MVAFPTDTVYGLAVDPRRPGAVERLFSLKGRPSDVPLPILVGSRAQVCSVAGRLDGAAADLAGRFWPGPLTLVVPRADGFCDRPGRPPVDRPYRGDPLARSPADRADVCPIGARWRSPAPTVTAPRPRPPSDQVAEAFAGSDGPTVIVDGGLCSGDPSTVVECLGQAIRCLREGAIGWSEISGPPGPNP